jgi:hypothetical protein
MSRILADKGGVEGIPLKLIIVMVILAITIPTTWSGLESYDRFQTENNLRSELDFLSANIKQVYLSGLGNAQEIEVNFKNGMMSKVENIKIGDTLDGIWSAIRYKLNHESMRILIIKNPNVPMGNEIQGRFHGLELGSGKHTIRLECKEGPDFDGDDTKDMFVEVSKVV